MNIFSDNDMDFSRDQCDVHVSKVIVEGFQMVCTVLNCRRVESPYRSIHARHPCVNWTGESGKNRLWVTQPAKVLNRGCHYRYQLKTDHPSIPVLDQIDGRNFTSGSLTELAQAMPDQYKAPGDPAAAYRSFHLHQKARFARRTRRDPPVWWKDVPVEEVRE